MSPSGGGGPTGTFSDNFNRADSTSLGTAWSEVSGDLVISGNMLKNALAVGNHMAVVSAPTGTAQTVSADFTSPDNNQGPRFGLILRYQNPTNYYVAYRQVGGSSVLRIARVVEWRRDRSSAASGIPNPAKNVPFRLAGARHGHDAVAGLRRRQQAQRHRHDLRDGQGRDPARLQLEGDPVPGGQLHGVGAVDSIDLVTLPSGWKEAS